MWYVAKFMRGLNVDEAIKQLSFMPFKTAVLSADVLKEAQDIAVRKHNFEFKSRMWIEDVKVGKGLTMRGVRKHARMRFGKINYYYVHLMIKLTEGDPPKLFYVPVKTGNDHLKDYFADLRARKIEQGL